MLNKKNRISAINSLEKSAKNYEEVQQQLIMNSELLHVQRTSLKDAIENIYIWINNMRNNPTDFKEEIQQIKIEFKKFEEFVAAINEEVEKTFKQATGGLGTGVAAGAGLAAFGPTAAMAIATTFGTASTGTAISTLTGAAATKAALAWLGGGAIASGGAGIAGGGALLALAGPIGWTIGGSTLIGAGLFRNAKNKKIAFQAKEQEIEIVKQTRIIQGTSQEIFETKELTKNTIQLLRSFSISVQKRVSEYEYDYHKIKNDNNDDLIKDLGSLINNLTVAIELLNRPIGGEK